MPAHSAKTPPLVVARFVQAESLDCGARLDWGRFGGLLGHAGLIHTF
jgi:hypothetical protein